MQAPGRKFWIWVAGLAGAASLGLLLYFFAPDQYAFYPRCAFYSLTGLKCPGCGGLRAAHYLVHGQLAKAFQSNPLLVLLPPILGIGLFYFRLRYPPGQPNSSIFDHPIWLWGLLGIVLGFAIIRNLVSP